MGSDVAVTGRMEEDLRFEFRFRLIAAGRCASRLIELFIPDRGDGQLGTEQGSDID